MTLIGFRLYWNRYNLRSDLTLLLFGEYFSGSIQKYFKNNRWCHLVKRLHMWTGGFVVQKSLLFGFSSVWNLMNLANILLWHRVIDCNNVPTISWLWHLIIMNCYNRSHGHWVQTIFLSQLCYLLPQSSGITRGKRK